MLSRVPSLAAAQLEARYSGGLAGDGTDEECELHTDELALDEALAMPPTSLVREVWAPAPGSCTEVLWARTEIPTDWSTVVGGFEPRRTPSTGQPQTLP